MSTATPDAGAFDPRASDDLLRGLSVRAEHEVGSYLQARHFIFTASGLLALQAALHAAGVEAGDEVVCDGLFPFGIMATLNLGGRPVLADIDPRTLTMSAASLAKMLSARTRAVVCTAAFGVPPNSRELHQTIAALRRVPLIEDHAQAFGSRVAARAAATEADFATFSFQRGKFLSCGAGGGVASRNRDWSESARRYIELGWYPRERAGKIDWESSWRERRANCQSARLPDVAAALLLVRLAAYTAERQQRVQATKKILDIIRDRVAWAIPQEAPSGFDDNRWRIVLVCPTPELAEDLTKAIEAVGSRAYRHVGPPPAAWPAFRDQILADRATATSDLLGRMVMLPTASLEDTTRELEALECL